MGSEVCFSSSSWLGTILSLFFWHWYPWGPSSMSIWSTVSSLSTSIFWNLPSGAQVPSVDKDFPGEVAEYRSLHPSALTSVFVCWAEELCEEVLADESVSKRCPARVFVVFGNWGCRPKEQEQARRSLGLCLCFQLVWLCVRSVIQSCLTLRNSMGCIPPVSSIHGILQARILEWVARLTSRGSSQPRDQTQISHIAADSLLLEKFKLWYNHRGHSSENGKRPLLSKGNCLRKF